MNLEIVFATDTATLAVFDPATLSGRIGDEVDWWTADFHQLPEVASGKIALAGLGSDGYYRVRVTSSAELEAAERAYAAKKVTLGVEVVSGRIFVGAGEHLPGGDSSPETDEELAGFFVGLPNGLYKAEIYAIVWQGAADWIVPAGEPIPKSAPPDLVLVLRPRQKFTKPKEEPRLVGDGSWLFPGEPRQVGPVPGMLIETVVVARGRERVLKWAGPGNYRPVLADMSAVAWKDRIVVRVLGSIDHNEKEFACELVRKLPPAAE